METAELSLVEYYEIYIDNLPGILWQTAVEYAYFFGGAFVALWVLLRPILKHRKIQQHTKAGPSQWVQEVVWSAIGQGGYLVLVLLLLPTNLMPLGMVYDWGDGETSWLATAFGVTFILVFDDTWFYWSHRWFHSNKTAYRKLHRIHHGSTDTTPLTGFRFHPAELFLIALPRYFLVWLVAFDWRVYVITTYASIFNNIYAHAGYEFLPSFWSKLPLLKYKTLSIHHNMHHERVRGNYGLYFTWWDRWMGTEFKDYQELEDQLFKRIKNESPLRPGRGDTPIQPEVEPIG